MEEPSIKHSILPPCPIMSDVEKLAIGHMTTSCRAKKPYMTKKQRDTLDSRSTTRDLESQMALIQRQNQLRRD